VTSRAILVAFLTLASLACHRQRLTIQYTPSAPPPPAFRVSVYVQVYDQRPPDRGGLDSKRVGWTPGKFGIPKRMRVPPDSVAGNVWSATADALAGVDIGASAGPTLIATVLEFWEDGIGGTGTHVAIRYQLVDLSGRQRWTATIRGGSGEPPDPTASRPAAGPGAPAVDIFAYALADLAARARVQFATAAFQQAVAP
jgi:hypothetical protein